VKITLKIRPRRILDFDIETRLVGFHSGGKFGPGGCEPTAIAWSWIGTAEVCVQLLGIHDPMTMLEEFAEVYDRADIVTGHYISHFDLPVLNGALMEHGLPLLRPKLVQDTCTGLKKRAGHSKSQENMAGMLGIPEAKQHMSDWRWRESTRLTPEGIEATRRRVVDDVIQHKALRAKLLERGLLNGPKLWTP
jgi:DNA polymerase elongation subunit (family B)